ncbi:MAG: hypothetical protein JWR50_3175 [Mucilaginibacter sp.]|nr:hypothetical protein [Mucilaginibacter sp.]
MSNQKPISQEQLDGRTEIFRIWEINLQSGKPYTMDDLANDKDHWLSVPVLQKTKTEIDIEESRSAAGHLRELNKQAKEVPVNIAAVKSSLAELGLKAVPINQ